jgi:hypothetical protein
MRALAHIPTKTVTSGYRAIKDGSRYNSYFPPPDERDRVIVKDGEVTDTVGKNADQKPLSSLQTDPHSVGTTHIQKSPMLPLYNSLVSIMDLPLLRGSISVRRRGVGLSDYSTPIDPYFFFQLKKVAWEIPIWREISSTRVPVSNCLIAKTI